MPEITVIDNEWATLWCNPKKKLVRHQFHKFTHGDNFNEVLTKGAEMFETHHCTKWLSDDRKLKIVHPENTAWGEKFWAPRIISAGWKYWAMLMPTETTGQMMSASIIDFFAKLGVTAKTFSDHDEALDWLESQP